MSDARLVSVNIGRCRGFVHKGRAVESAIWKSPVAGQVAVTPFGLQGDETGDRERHGGIDQAVYAYSREDYCWWEAELGMRLEPGTFGENLTVGGMPLSDVGLGESWRIGEAVLEATQPRIPCWRFEHRMNLEGWIVRFREARRPGVYLRVLADGHIRAGDAVQREESDGPKIYSMFTIRVFEPARAREIMHPKLGERWRTWTETAGCA